MDTTSPNPLAAAIAQLNAGSQLYIKVMRERGLKVGQPISADSLAMLSFYVDADGDFMCSGSGSPEMWSRMMLGFAEASEDFRLALAAVFSHLVDAQRRRDP